MTFLKKLTQGSRFWPKLKSVSFPVLRMCSMSVVDYTRGVIGLDDLETVVLRKAIKPVVARIGFSVVGFYLVSARTCPVQSARDIGWDVSGNLELDRLSFLMNNIKLQDDAVNDVACHGATPFYRSCQRQRLSNDESLPALHRPAARRRVPQPPALKQ